MRRRYAAGLMMVVAAVSVTACSSTGHPSAGASPSQQAPASPTQQAPASPGSPSIAVSGPLGAAGCHPASPRSPSNGGYQQEVQGTPHGATLWGLLFFTGSPRTSTQAKIVWRMTGAGPFDIVALGPAGRRLNPVWGPEAHGSSTWNRPGQEWGTVFTFSVPGCWDLHAARTGSSADVWLEVVGVGRPMLPGSAGG